MDVNDQLDKIRHAVARAQQFNDLGQTGANYTWQLERAADAFTLLDMYLSGGGTPPEVWREGPDAVGEDRQGPDAAGEEGRIVGALTRDQWAIVHDSLCLNPDDAADTVADAVMTIVFPLPSRDDDEGSDGRSCERCGEAVQYLSSDDLCDGCVAYNDSRVVL